MQCGRHSFNTSCRGLFRSFKSSGQSRHTRPHKPTHQNSTHNHDRQDRLTSTYRHNPSSKSDPHETRGTAGTPEPPGAQNPRRRQKNMKRHHNDARDPPGPKDRKERRPGSKLAESQPGQRERERERENASATLTRPITDGPAAHGLSSTLFPNETTRIQLPLGNDPVPLPRALLHRYASTTGAKPNPTLFRPKPPYRRTSPQAGATGHGSFIPEHGSPVKPYRQK